MQDMLTVIDESGSMPNKEQSIMCFEKTKLRIKQDPRNVFVMFGIDMSQQGADETFVNGRKVDNA